MTTADYLRPSTKSINRLQLEAAHLEQTTQDENLERVRERIVAAVLEFCRSNRQFQMAELAAFVQSRVGVATDSPGRILRSLRQAGEINYRVVDRRKSIYVIEAKLTVPAVSLFRDISPDQSYRE